MSFRKGGAGKKRDAIEPDVITELHAFGVWVLQINGRASPDLLTLYRGRWLPLGVKSGTKARLTDSEKQNRPQWPLVASVDEAVKAVCG